MLSVPHGGGVGGVGGRRLIRRDEAQMKEAQQSYIAADSGIKAWESRLGYTTANDGKLYAVREKAAQNYHTP